MIANIGLCSRSDAGMKMAEKHRRHWNAFVEYRGVSESFAPLFGPAALRAALNQDNWI
jgi:hypothetical protein